MACCSQAGSTLSSTSPETMCRCAPTPSTWPRSRGWSRSTSMARCACGPAEVFQKPGLAASVQRHCFHNGKYQLLFRLQFWALPTRSGLQLQPKITFCKSPSPPGCICREFGPLFSDLVKCHLVRTGGFCYTQASNLRWTVWPRKMKNLLTAGWRMK